MFDFSPGPFHQWVMIGLVFFLFLFELRLDDMLLGNTIVPGQWLHSVHNNSVGAHVAPDVGIFFNKLVITVAEIVCLDNMETRDDVLDDCEDVGKNSADHTFQSEACSHVIKAPVLDIITDLLELANLVVFVGDVEESCTSLSPIIVGC